MDNIQNETTLKMGATLQDGRYTIVKVLGQGGFGITYQAITKEKVTGNLGVMEVEVPVAIKEFFMKDTCVRESNDNVSIPSTGSTAQVEKYRQKFVKEAHNLSQLDHPNIVHVADVFEENNTVYYVMQFLKDGSLRNYIKANGPLKEEDALKYTIDIGRALEYMHTTKHMCHYDVKPGNILLNGGKAMLIDFGISKNYTSDGRETSATPVGLSKGFAPLEQFQQSLQDFSPVTDIYSLGATLYSLLTGKVPPEASIINEEGLGARPQQISENTWRAIVAAMQPRRRDRPQEMSRFIGYLDGSITIPITANESEETMVMGEGNDVSSNSQPSTPPPPPITSRPPTTSRPPITSRPPVTSQPPTTSRPGIDTYNTSGAAYSDTTAPKSNKLPLIIGGVGGVLLLIAIAVVAFIVYPKLKGGDSADPDNTEVSVSRQTVTEEPIYGADNSVAFKYTGEVNENMKPDGKGVAKYTDSVKDTYKGKFKNGVRVDENGELTFKNGDSYKGTFVDDHFGEGTYTIAEDKSYFVGTFQDYNPYTGEWYDKTGKLLYKVVNGVDQ